MGSIIASYRNAYSGLPRDVWLISIVALINRSGTMVLPFLSLYLTSQLQLSDSYAGLLIGTYGCGAILGAYLGGALSSWIGPLRTIALSLALTAPGMFVIPLAGSFVALLACMAYLSIVAEAVRPATITAATQVCLPHQHPKAMALVRLAVNMGMSIGPALGGFLAGINFAWLFIADGLTCLAACVFLLLFFRLREPSGPVAGSDPAEQPPSDSSPWRDLPYLYFLGFTLITSLVFFQLVSTFPLYLRDHYRMSEFQIGLLLAINTVVIVLFEMVLIDRARRWNVMRTVAWGSFLSCIGFGILPLGNTMLFCAGTILVWTVGEMLSMPLSAVYATQRSSHRQRGKYMGMFTMCYAVAFVIAPVSGMRIYQWNRHLVWYLCLLIGVIVLFGFYWLARRPPRRANAGRTE